jgi:DNA (cytosine-5)-methyltransferase 1
VFIIGHLRGSGGGKVFPFGRKGESTTTEPGEKTKEIKVVGRIGNGIHDSNRVIDPTGIAQTMQARDYKDPIKVAVGINQIGNLIDTDSFGGNPQRGRVYGTDGISPSLNTVGGGGLEPKVAIPVLTPDRAEKRQNGRRFKEDGEPMFTITAQDRHGVMVKEATKPGEQVSQKVVSFDRKNGIGDELEIAHTLNASDWRGLNRNQAQNAVMVNEQKVAILRPKRTEYGKAIRKDYESGKVDESRHNMTKLEPVFDGVSNTITTVQKDNLLLDQRYIDGMSDAYLQSKNGTFGKINEYPLDGCAPTLTATCYKEPDMIRRGFRIRKLTPKECWRLQGFPDWSFERARADGISDSQLYKQAGNSVTVNVVYEIAKRLR